LANDSSLEVERVTVHEADHLGRLIYKKERFDKGLVGWKGCTTQYSQTRFKQAKRRGSIQIGRYGPVPNQTQVKTLGKKRLVESGGRKFSMDRQTPVFPLSTTNGGSAT